MAWGNLHNSKLKCHIFWFPHVIGMLWSCVNPASASGLIAHLCSPVQPFWAFWNDCKGLGKESFKRDPHCSLGGHMLLVLLSGCLKHALECILEDLEAGSSNMCWPPCSWLWPCAAMVRAVLLSQRWDSASRKRQNGGWAGGGRPMGDPAKGGGGAKIWPLGQILTLA